MIHPLSNLITQLKKLPGIGEKSASRLAFFLLSLPPEEINQFAKTMVDTKQKVRYCEKCFNISFETICNICKDSLRNQTQICLVAEPKDIFAIEKSKSYQGVYHVLGGLLSPLDGFHPEMLRIPELLKRIETNHFSELILAINPSIEGDATILYLTSLLKNTNIKITRLAYGLPMGSDLEYADEITLQKALQGRIQIDER